MSRKGSSGMSNNSGSRAVQNVFGMSANQAAKNYWDNLRLPAGEKYAQVEGAAKGDTGVLGAQTHVYDVIRTQAGDNNPDLVNGRGKNATWKSGYQDTIRGRLGEAGRNTLISAIQDEAQAWLNKNPRPANPRKNGYRWNGTRYVKG